mgnify:CR=1 FL=1
MRVQYAVGFVGHRGQNIAVEDEASAKAAINYLKKNNAGRATFYPVSSVSGQNPTQEMINAKKCKGYIGVATELVEQLLSMPS